MTWLQSTQPTSAKFGAPFVSQEVTHTCQELRVLKAWKGKVCQDIVNQENQTFALQRLPHMKVLNKLSHLPESVKAPNMDPSWYAWRYCIEFCHPFLEKIKQAYFITSFLVFTYSVFILINNNNNNQECQNSLVALTPFSASLSSSVKRHQASVALRATDLLTVCAITKSCLCVSTEFAPPLIALHKCPINAS